VLAAEAAAVEAGKTLLVLDTSNPGASGCTSASAGNGLA